MMNLETAKKLEKQFALTLNGGGLIPMSSMITEENGDSIVYINIYANGKKIEKRFYWEKELTEFIDFLNKLKIIRRCSKYSINFEVDEKDRIIIYVEGKEMSNEDLDECVKTIKDYLIKEAIEIGKSLMAQMRAATSISRLLVDAENNANVNSGYVMTVRHELANERIADFGHITSASNVGKIHALGDKYTVDLNHAIETMKKYLSDLYEIRSYKTIEATRKEAAAEIKKENPTVIDTLFRELVDERSTEKIVVKYKEITKGLESLIQQIQSNIFSGQEVAIPEEESYYHQFNIQELYYILNLFDYLPRMLNEVHFQLRMNSDVLIPKEAELRNQLNQYLPLLKSSSSEERLSAAKSIAALPIEELNFSITSPIPKIESSLVEDPLNSDKRSNHILDPSVYYGRGTR